MNKNFSYSSYLEKLELSHKFKVPQITKTPTLNNLSLTVLSGLTPVLKSVNKKLLKNYFINNFLIGYNLFNQKPTTYICAYNKNFDNSIKGANITPLSQLYFKNKFNITQAFRQNNFCAESYISNNFIKRRRKALKVNPLQKLKSEFGLMNTSHTCSFYFYMQYFISTDVMRGIVNYKNTLNIENLMLKLTLDIKNISIFNRIFKEDTAKAIKFLPFFWYV